VSWVVHDVEGESNERERERDAPVGPPPTMTKLSRFLRSSSVTVGWHASSKHSRMRCRILAASRTSLRK